MILSTLEELRLYFPTHALDNIEPMTGFLDNSEHDVLQEKLGRELYDKLCEFYKDLDIDALIELVQNNGTIPYYAQLLMLSQRVIAFDAFARAIGVNAISINNAGVNVATADDYGQPTKEAIADFKTTCIKETHAAINRLLQELEYWVSRPVASDTDLTEIITLWKKSRYYYLAAQMLIPSAEVMQHYLNIYDSREKFIQMLPDLSYLQEEEFAPALGEDFLDYIVGKAVSGTEDTTLLRIIHALRKAMAAMVEERTQVLKVSADRKQKAHDESVRLMKRAVEYISVHINDLPADSATALSTSPLAPVSSDTSLDRERKFENNRRGNRIFVTPAID